MLLCPCSWPSHLTFSKFSELLIFQDPALLWRVLSGSPWQIILTAFPLGCSSTPGLNTLVHVHIILLLFVCTCHSAWTTGWSQESRSHIFLIFHPNHPVQYLTHGRYSFSISWWLECQDSYKFFSSFQWENCTLGPKIRIKTQAC